LSTRIVAPGHTAGAMPNQNADVARRTFEAIGSWDIDGLLELYDADVENGKVTRHRGYRTRDEALEAAGLRD
jgi:ketosteroid isomerase-like protein